MEVQIGVSKINKHETSISGDTLEVIERPSGGLSVVLVSGKVVGENIKSLSSTIAHQIICLLDDGVRDGVALCQVSDLLHQEYKGRQTAFVNVLSVDSLFQTIMISSNNPLPVFSVYDGYFKHIQCDPTALGHSENVRPSVSQLPLNAGSVLVILSEGFTRAGAVSGKEIDICTLLTSLVDDQQPSAQYIADTIISEAVRLDEGQPQNDYSVAVVGVHEISTTRFRKLSIQLPVDSSNDSSNDSF